MMHTKGPWRRGTHGGIVADYPIEGGVPGTADTSYYGGHLVAETVAACNEPLIIAAPELADSLTQMVDWYGKRNITSQDDALLPPEKQTPEIARAMDLLARINGRAA